MASATQGQEGIAGVGGLLRWLWRFLASLKLAVVLIVALAIVLAWATLLESARGREYAQWSVYGRSWFIALWALLAVNILAAVLIRFPWKKRRIGFLIAHAGLLVLLAGGLQTLVGGIAGRLAFLEGETADSILIPDRSQLTVSWREQHLPKAVDFPFPPGPVDWPSGKTRDLGQCDGVGVRVLKFYAHARPEVDWVADDSGLGGPALKLAPQGSDGQPVGEIWCVWSPLGSRMLEGGPRLELHQAPAESLLQDFLEPPTDNLGQRGLLSVHYQGHVYPVAVDENLGKEVPLGDSGLSVKITQYYACAVVEGGGRFTSVGTEPKNPMLQLEVHLPDAKEPIPEIAYALAPFVNYELMRGRTCPLKFWYHHPGVPILPGAEFLRTPDDKLYCRLAVDGKYLPRGEVKQGHRIRISPDLEVSILRYLPHARQEVTFCPVELAKGETADLEAAALVELTAAGKTRQVWLARNDQQHEFQRIQTPQGPLLVSLEYARLPLGFSLRLLDFQRGMNPGRMGDASFSSSVQLMDPAAKIDEPRDISMNKPLSHGKFSFYQSTFEELPDGRQASILSVAYDPGRTLKYLGCLMICVGTFVMFYLRRRFAMRG